jgi:hypothetical protein
MQALAAEAAALLRKSLLTGLFRMEILLNGLAALWCRRTVSVCAV